MCEESSTRVDLGQFGSDFITDHLDDLIFIEKVNLPLCWMDIDVNAVGLDLQVEIHERVAAFWQERRVRLFHGSFDGSRFDRTVVDKKEYSGLFDMVVGIGSKTRGTKPKLVVGDLVFDQLVGDRATMNLTNPVNGIGA